MSKTRSEKALATNQEAQDFLQELIVYLPQKSEQNKLRSMKQKIILDAKLKQKEIDKLSTIFNQGIRNYNKDDVVRNFGIWGDLWEDKIKKFKKLSEYSHFPSYRIRTFIVKAADDLRLELIAMQLIKKFQLIFTEAKLNLYLRPYEIIVTSPNSGLIEYIPNTKSIDEIKKEFNGLVSISKFFKETFENSFQEAQKNFVESLAGYSLVCYLLEIKDRHNGNILLDNEGHLIHIDFGFILSLTPGKIGFETAPFKLTNEYVEILEGKHSNLFTYYKMLLFQGFLELRKHVDTITFLLECMVDSDLPCFQNLNLQAFKARFYQNYTDKECMSIVDKLVDQSVDNWRTQQYDSFQKITNGILP